MTNYTLHLYELTEEISETMSKITWLSQAQAALRPEIANVLDAQCGLLAPDELIELRQRVISYTEQIRAALRINEFIDITLVEKITECMIFLLDLYTEFPPEQQRMITGAARYFVQQNDVEPDTMSVLGFDDDVEVLNYVLDEIGQPQLKVII